MDSSDLESGQVGEVDGDLAVLGADGPAERNVRRLNEREEAASDAHLRGARRAAPSAVPSRRHQQPDQRPQLQAAAASASFTHRVLILPTRSRPDAFVRSQMHWQPHSVHAASNNSTQHRRVQQTIRATAPPVSQWDSATSRQRSLHGLMGSGRFIYYISG